MHNYKKCLFDNSIYEKITRYLFPTVLILYAFLGVNRGIDLTDVGYNLGNYKYLSGLDGMWYYSTFIANLTGYILTHLPFGSTMLGMEVYCCIIKALFSLFAYVFFVKDGKFLREASFLGIFTSLSLCWAPQVCIYHYFSYYAFFLIAALIFHAVTNPGKEDLLVLAGFLVVFSVFIRFPNICYAALIVPLWFHSYISKDKFGDVVRKTGKCLAGFTVTLITTVYLLLSYGVMGDYLEAIKDLFSMTDESERYGLKFTLVNLVNSYTCIWYWLIPVAAATVLLVAAGFVKTRFKPDIAVNIGTVAGVGLIYYWFKKTALFDYDFTSYSSMYLFGVVILTISLVLFVVVALSTHFSDRLRLLAAMAIVIQMITPFGTNNSLYVVLNSLFFIMPVAYMSIAELARFKPTKYLHTAYITLFFLFTVQMVFFYNGFTFREKQHEPQDTYIAGNDVLAGMRTTASNAELLNDLNKVWNSYGLKEESVLIFSETPGVAYYMGSKPAISSTWPTLASYSVSKFESQMRALSDRMIKNGEKVVVVTDDQIDREGRKQDIIKKFLNEKGYVTIYDDHGLKVWHLEGE